MAVTKTQRDLRKILKNQADMQTMLTEICDDISSRKQHEADVLEYQDKEQRRLIELAKKMGIFKGE